MTVSTKTWVHGLGAAAIGGSASSFTTMLLDPQKFNLDTMDGARHMLIAGLVGGCTHAFMFLKQSPLPSMALQPGDRLNMQDPSMAPDGTLTAASAQLTKAPEGK